jgi:hypothetical protein
MAMRRFLAFAGLVLLAGSLQMAAQRGGGHGASGGHSGFSGGSHFSAGSGHSFSGVRSGSSFAPRSGSRASTFRSPLASRSLRPRNNSTSLRLRTYGYGRGYGFRNCYGGYGCGYGYGGYGYPYIGGAFDPYWWWDSGSSYDQDYQDQVGLANEMNQQSLDEQRMRQQAEQYSSGQYSSEPNSYARSRAPAARQAERTQAVPPTVLIFRDQHKEEIQNYAIIGQTLWNFSPQRTEKIPLSDLDLPATTKENDERGLDFRLPAGSEGQ